MEVTRRKVLTGGGAALSVPFLTRTASAQAWPARPVKVIIPYPAGGGADTTGRILFGRLSEVWGQQFVIDNRGGAGGTIAEAIAAKADPDGYTILYDATAFSINPFLYSKLSFDYGKDFQPVTLTTLVPNILVLTTTVEAKTVADVIAMAKAAPDGLDFASSGNGTVQHLSLEMFRHMTGTKINHIPYRGGGPALNDVIGGQVKFFFSNGSASVGLVQAGTVKASRTPARAGSRRCRTCRRYPTPFRASRPTSGTACSCRPGRRPAIIQKLNAGLNAMLQGPGGDRAARQAQCRVPAEHAGGISRVRCVRDGALEPRREGGQHQARIRPALDRPNSLSSWPESSIRIPAVRSVLLRVLFAADLSRRSPCPPRPRCAFWRVPAGRSARSCELFETVRASGERVVIDGPCLSACTLVLMSLPRSRICVTPRAIFGFHAATSRDFLGRHVYEAEATGGGARRLSARVRHWIARHGGLSSACCCCAAASLPRCIRAAASVRYSASPYRRPNDCGSCGQGRCIH